MSFICEKCKKHIKGKPHKHVTEIRFKVYPKRYDKTGEILIDNGGKGHETVEEIDICDKCLKNLKSFEQNTFHVKQFI